MPAIREMNMIETNVVTEVAAEPCPRCGWVKFNPDCPECQEVREQCLLMGTGIEGFDM
jgi:hypothetical protein